MKEFITRTITAFFLIIAAYALVKYLPIPWFSLFLFLVISLGTHELVRLTKPVKYSLPLMIVGGLAVGLAFTFNKPSLAEAILLNLILTGLFFLFIIRQKNALTSFVRDMGIHFIAMVYLYIPLYYLLELKRLGPNYLFFMIFVIAVGDTGAYFVGSFIGKHKIYPVASPKKSLEGLIAAIATAGLCGWLSILIFPVPVTVWKAVATGAVMGLFSQLSDPIESLFKRAAGQKDSGSILPGHGGVLDRVDSYIFCAPVLFYIVIYLWK